MHTSSNPKTLSSNLEQPLQQSIPWWSDLDPATYAELQLPPVREVARQHRLERALHLALSPSSPGAPGGSCQPGHRGATYQASRFDQPQNIGPTRAVGNRLPAKVPDLPTDWPATTPGSQDDPVTCELMRLVHALTPSARRRAGRYYHPSRVASPAVHTCGFRCGEPFDRRAPSISD